MQSFSNFFREVHLFDHTEPEGKGELLLKFHHVVFGHMVEHGELVLQLDARFNLEGGGFVAKVCKVTKVVQKDRSLEFDQLIIERYDGTTLVFLSARDGTWKLLQEEVELFVHNEGAHSLNMLLQEFNILEQYHSVPRTETLLN